VASWGPLAPGGGPWLGGSPPAAGGLWGPGGRGARGGAIGPRGSVRRGGGHFVPWGMGGAPPPRCPWITDKKRASPGGATDTLARFCRPSRPVLLFSNVPGATRSALAPGYHLPRLRRSDDHVPDHLLGVRRNRQQRNAHLNQRELIRQLKERIERRIAGLQTFNLIRTTAELFKNWHTIGTQIRKGRPTRTP
jgi:hypothetical protein